VSGAATWPQVFVGGKLIGDADAVAAHFARQAPAEAR
jgi:glutathione-dependent peroxiredoxin